MIFNMDILEKFNTKTMAEKYLMLCMYGIKVVA